jgi:hypothetical protein
MQVGPGPLPAPLHAVLKEWSPLSGSNRRPPLYAPVLKKSPKQAGLTRNPAVSGTNDKR